MLDNLRSKQHSYEIDFAYTCMVIIDKSAHNHIRIIN